VALVRARPKRIGPGHLVEYVERTGGHPLFRPNSIDGSVWGEVAREYPIAPGEFSPGDAVIDIGAHIGAFSALAAMRGAGKVIALEADGKNCEIARSNLAPFPQCEVRNAAVWRSDLPQIEDLLYVPATDPLNTGGGSVLFDKPEASRHFGGYGATPSPVAGGVGCGPHASVHRVDGVALDEILRELRALRCLKIDAEGSEFPILLTATLLDRVREIVGEFHECSEDQAKLVHPSAAIRPGCFRIETLAGHLRGQGFAVVWRRTGRNIGLFSACRDRSAASRARRILAFHGTAA